MSRSWVGILLVVLLLCSPLSATTVGAASMDAMALQQEFDSTEFHITVYENGSARWTFKYKKTLNDSNRQEFKAYAERFNENETELYRTFKDRARALTRAGTNATGRQMDATRFSKRAYVTNLGNRGVVKMSFTWTNFAPTRNGRVIVADVFEGGLYIGPDQRLVIEQGPNLVIQSVEPKPDARSNDSVTWEGEQEFADNHPRVVLVNESAAGGQPGDGTRPTDGADEGQSGILLWVALLLIVLLGGALLAWRAGLVSKVRGTGPPPAAEPEEAAGETVTGEAAEKAPPEEPEPSAEAPAPAEEPAETTEAEGEAETEPAVTDEELMSDEERVEKLLREHGGRMKQVNIVDQTDWSKSKVSMLLSDMEEEGKISKLRIGRENVISLPGYEPEGTGSPFEEEGE